MLLAVTITLIFLISISKNAVLAHSFSIRLTNDGPIVKGGTITFNATVYDGSEISNDQFSFFWTDDAIPQHSRQTDYQNATSIWTVTYNASSYTQGNYVVRVYVQQKCFLSIFCFDGSKGTGFYISETLHGELKLAQKNQTKVNNFVSNTDPVVHKIDIKTSDKYLIDTATTVSTHWFVDCTYYGISDDFALNYTKPDEEHTVEALVVADFTPLAPTTTVPPSTTTTKTTTSKPNTTTAKHNVTSVPQPVIRNIRSVQDQRITVKVNGTLVPYNGTFPFICNGTRVITDKKKTYGYFNKKYTVKAPISKINVTGSNWLQHGDMLSLSIHCQGSHQIQYCVRYEVGLYNVTGNETCNYYLHLNECAFIINRYFSESTQHTILVIIKNDVSKVVTPIAVTVYKVNKQAQLSVIVVPVASGLVAVVLIVFGVAYYIQNRSRFTVEVADFNFGQQYNDLEYKTFRERLRDSITNAFTRSPSPGSSEVPVWPPGRKYGSMT